MTDLDTYLRSRTDRCSGCGFHPATQGHGPACAPVAPASEWPFFVSVLRSCTRDDGTVHVNDVRPRVRGRIEPKHIGQAYSRASRERLIRHQGWEPSTDIEGANADKLARVYEWIGVAA